MINAKIKPTDKRPGVRIVNDYGEYVEAVKAGVPFEVQDIGLLKYLNCEISFRPYSEPGAVDVVKPAFPSAFPVPENERGRVLEGEDLLAAL